MDAFAAQPALSTDVLNSLRGLATEDDPTFVAELLTIYLANLDERIKGVAQGIQQSDPARFAASAHSLKSSSASIGALALAELCKDLESLGREGRLEGAREIFEKLEIEGRRVEREILTMPEVGAFQSSKAA